MPLYGALSAVVPVSAQPGCTQCSAAKCCESLHGYSLLRRLHWPWPSKPAWTQVHVDASDGARGAAGGRSEGGISRALRSTGRPARTSDRRALQQSVSRAANAALT